MKSFLSGIVALCAGAYLAQAQSGNGRGHFFTGNGNNSGNFFTLDDARIQNQQVRERYNPSYFNPGRVEPNGRVLSPRNQGNQRRGQANVQGRQRGRALGGPQQSQRQRAHRAVNNQNARGKGTGQVGASVPRANKSPRP